LKGQPYLYGLIFLMVLFWSANYIVAKVALREFPALLLSGVRVTLAGLLMLPIYFSRPARSVKGRVEAVQLVVLGLCGVALNQLFFVIGLGRTTVAHASIIVSVGPVLVLLIAAAVRLERMTVAKVSGMLMAMAGIAALKLFQDSATTQHATWFGDVFVFLSTLTFALFTVFGKPLTLRHSSITVNTFAYVAGAIAMAPITIWQVTIFPLSHISFTAWMCALYMVLFPSIGSYLIYYHALTHIPASRVASFSYLQPVFAIAMAVVVIGERLTPPVVAAGIGILAGVYITERG
jgi:drug/metabolite transporter (DMT)-like permease